MIQKKVLGSGSSLNPDPRIWIHYSGKVDPDPLSRKGGFEDPDPLFPNVDPRIRIRIHVKMRWIRNTGENPKPDEKKSRQMNKNQFRMVR